ncbi:HAD hydrolase-like protein [uncultured Prevotella sp.]|uniref:KdsC family phosphatase n=1 Tax=uncultured Prevotella sp. TaxID=159272 RepID=UPI00260619E4|nr:HAD hydrolase-like protein [uncultured Prevotella sp.]
MINYDLKKVRAVIFDIDGVLSANTITLHPEGEPMRTVNIKDGYAMQLAVKQGLHIAIMTGADVKSIRMRYEKLGVKDIFTGCSVKIRVYEKFLADNALSDEEVIFVGDDIPDYEVMSRCGCPCCPADACPDIKRVSRYVSNQNGGYGVGRDILEQVLRAQGKWLADKKAFGW